jgi:hypothetical protein
MSPLYTRMVRASPQVAYALLVCTRQRGVPCLARENRQSAMSLTSPRRGYMLAAGP